MQLYDVFMLIVLVGTVLFGFWKGMAWQIASLASIFLSAVVAINLSPQLAPLISEQEPWNRIVAMLALYLATALAIWLIFRLVARMIDRVKLKEFDHQIGAMFGLAKGVLWCVIITFFAVTLSQPARQIVRGTYSGRYIAMLIKHATPVLPEEVTSVVGGYLEQLDEGLDPNGPIEIPTSKEPLLGPDATGLKDAGKSILGDLKQGLEGKLDAMKDDLKDAVDDAHKQTQGQIENLPKGGDSSSGDAQGAGQGRGGGGWWR